MGNASARGNSAIRRTLGTLGALVVVVGAMAVVWAVGVMAHPVPEPSEPEPVTVRVVEGTVEDSSQYSAVIERETLVPVLNRATGTLTAMPSDHVIRISAGDQLYEVDERPVTVAVGTVPMYRDIARGAAGEDVRQAQQMLADAGLLSGPVDGVAGQQFVNAVRAWQRDLYVDDTGVIGIGDIVFIPQLPAAVAVSTEYAVGAILVGGEPLLTPIAAQASTSIVVPETQSAEIPAGAAVTVVVGEQEIDGKVGDRQATESGNTRVEITSPDDSPLCDQGCAESLDQLSTAVLATVVRVPQTSGLTVPVTALWTDEAGGVSLRPLVGEPVDVEIAASATGIAVVEGEGVVAGMAVLVAEGGTG